MEKGAYFETLKKNAQVVVVYTCRSYMKMALEHGRKIKNVCGHR